MSGDRRSRRRFLADALFAGGALTAASLLGYVATHEAAVTTPQSTPTPVVVQPDVRPPGQMVALPSPPRQDLQPAGEPMPAMTPAHWETGGKCR